MSNNEPAKHLHFLSSFEAGWNGLNLIYELEPPDEIPETHIGQHLIVIVLEDVRISLMQNSNWQHFDYTEGDIVIIPASQAFPQTLIDRQFKLIDLFLDRTMLNSATDIDTDGIELVPQFKLRDPLIHQMGLALKAELETGGADSQLYAESMGTALSVHLMRRYSVRLPQIKEYTGGLPKYRLKQAIAYINENLDQHLTLSELSSVVQISPHYFASLFKQSTGLAPHQYVTKCRIERAKQLLLQRDLTLVEICYQVGFQNQSHFTRVFRQYVKTTPKAYRDSI